MTRTARIVGLACLAGFIACIFVANYAITHWGDVEFPGGPHTVTLLGFTAPSGVLVVGLSFSFRDGAQLALGRWAILAAIVAGALLSYLVAPSLAFASGAAFLFGEGCDWALYTPLAERGRYVAALTASNTVGALVDSVVFLWLAFGSLEFLAGQVVGKLEMTVLAVLVLSVWRTRCRPVRGLGAVG